MKKELLQLTLKKYIVTSDYYEQLYTNKLHNLEKMDTLFRNTPNQY